MTNSEKLPVYHICKSCGNTFQGKYCNTCGEKVIEPYERSLAYFFGKIINAFILVDNKLLQTIWLLIIRPGFLSKEYVNGIRKKHYKPLSLFFMANLLYFLFPVFETFNSSLNTQMKLTFHSEIATKIVDRKIEKEKISLDDFRGKYEQQSSNLAKLLIILMAVFLSLPLALLFYSRKSFYSDHLMIALEYNSYNLFVNNIFLPLPIFPVLFLSQYLAHINIKPYLNDQTFSFIILLTSFYFFINAFKRFYGGKTVVIILKTIVIFLFLFIILELYRFILFFITIWTI